MEYVSGSCNIGPAEIQKRKSAGYFGLALYLICAAVVIFSSEPVWVRGISFIPALIGSVGFIQARRKFCVAYGFMGAFNFGTASKVTDKAALTADRKYALSVLAQALIISLALTLILYVI